MKKICVAAMFFLYPLGITIMILMMLSHPRPIRVISSSAAVTTTTVHRPKNAVTTTTVHRSSHPAIPKGMNNQYHSIYVNGDPGYDSSDNNDYVVATKCAGFGHFRVWIQYDHAVFVNSDYACP